MTQKLPNLIFLDMDGVISTPRACLVQADLPHPDCFMDPIAMQYLNLICRTGRARVVLSSSWRLIYEEEEFIGFMHAHGFSGVFHGDWRTRGSANGFRGDEVQEWRDRHPEETGTYVILDDDGDFHPHQPLVKTSALNGLLMEDYERALRFLQPEEEPFKLWSMSRTQAIGVMQEQSGR